jgi:putative phosphoribosyl transferase
MSGSLDATIERLRVAVGPGRRDGILRRPSSALGLVIFAHGAGSSRLSPRNTRVAEELAQRGLTSLLFDLLTEEEAESRANVFDIPLLGSRVVEAIRWARNEHSLAELPIGLFGASTGAAAALVAAASEDVAAVVSRGGRPDLAGAALAKVAAPTLLVVGGADRGVIDLNQAAARALRCEHRLAIVPGATHLFEEPGALDQVVDLAGDWFEQHFRRNAR